MGINLNNIPDLLRSSSVLTIVHENSTCHFRMKMSNFCSRHMVIHGEFAFFGRNQNLTRPNFIRLDIILNVSELYDAGLPEYAKSFRNIDG